MIVCNKLYFNIFLNIIYLYNILFYFINIEILLNTIAKFLSSTNWSNLILNNIIMNKTKILKTMHIRNSKKYS